MNQRILFICLILLLVSCSHKTTSSYIKTYEIRAEHSYNNNILSGEIKIPSKYAKHNMELNAKLSMSEENKQISILKLKNNGEIYSFSQKLPKEGRWNIIYTLTHQGQTIIKKYTDVFGDMQMDLNEIEFLKISTNPNPVIPNKDVRIEVNILNKKGSLLKNCEVILQIENNDINYVNSLNMSNKNGIYTINTKLPKNGRYKLTTHINYSKGHKMESMDLLVGNKK
ncbi:hypothetical protein [Gottfriedia acidiceleris]|uniref:Macroglobulin domain-containing protein n=1 Tax=Gottfriedia acidiceleris TaxID=371036 RepID=A0ABY4JIP5_9BACI|nr:hypothetical protein [Gottfriedia acidiceleris]UPM53481.1 hypothetical protein MY490_17040 [Gottfriedia acidiceleris]